MSAIGGLPRGFAQRLAMPLARALGAAGLAWPVLLAACGILLLRQGAGASAGTHAGDSAALFRDVAEASGLRFVHDNGGTGRLYMPEIMGSGGALFDYDNDGDLDAFLVQGRPLEDGGRDTGGHRLFRNDGVRGGLPRFTDVTAQAGVGARTIGMGAAVADVDGDGWQDLYVTGFGPNVLFRNNGDGTFRDVTQQAGADDPRWSTSAAFLDFDRDGDMDLFVVNYVAFTVANHKVCNDNVGVPDYCPPQAYPPVPAKLLRNDGGLRFTDVTERAGIAAAYGAGLGVATGDVNGDGWLDVYVANDATPNQLWINRRDGTFEDHGLLSGTAVNAAGRPEGSMGIALGDADGDGDEDIFVSNLTGESHVFYRNDGEGNFEDDRAGTGLAAPTAPMTGFGTGWIDYDQDARLDLLLVNGAVNVLEALRGEPMPFRQPKQLFHNDGAGRFTDVSASAGAVFTRRLVGRGAAFGDVDNDGDIDVLVTNNNGSAELLLNEAPKAGHWLQVALRSGTGNRRGVGSRVGVEQAGSRTSWRRARTDGSYLVAGDDRVHFGLGGHSRVDRIIVEWADGLRETFEGGPADRLVTLQRGAGRAASPAEKP